MALKELSISTLKLPGDMTKRMAATHVKRRAKSISEIGLIHYPVVRQENWELVAGADRLAACMLLGWENVTCDVRELSEADADVLRHAENAERRHSTEEERAEQEALQKALERQLIEQGMARSGPGRRRTAKGEARRMVADYAGVSEEAMRKREQRKKAKTNGKEPKPVWLPSEPPPAIPLDEPTEEIARGADPMKLETFGLEVDDAFHRQVLEVHSRVYKAETAASAIKRQLTMIANSDLPFNSVLLGQMREVADQLGSMLRGFEPECLCPYCKGTEGVQEQCGLCCGCGWITKTQHGQVPPKFLDGKELVIMQNGEVVSLSGVVSSEDTDPFS